MDRNFLKDLGIEDKSVIDAILDRRGEEIEAEKKAHEDLESDLKKAQDTIDKMASSKADAEEIQKEADEYKEKYEKEKSAREKSDIKNNIKLKLTQEGATDLDYLEYKLGEVESADDIDGKVAELKEELPRFFDQDQPTESNEAQKKKEQAGYKILNNKLEHGDPPKKLTKEDIKAVKDPEKRQKLIAENPELFNYHNEGD